MEILIIFLSSLITLISPVETVGDRLAEATIRKQLAAAEQLQVRIDNTPSYQILGGKADRIRIAGRGLFPFKDLRIEALEVETDPIYLDARRLRRGKTRLLEPLGAGIRLVIKETDIQQALRSPTAVDQIRKTVIRLLGRRQARQAQKIQVFNPQIEFLDGQRLRLQVQLREVGDPKTLDIFAESGIEVTNGTQFRLRSPVLRLNGEPAPPELLNGIVEGMPERSDLRQFEAAGITARVLQFKLDSNQLELATFIRLMPKNRTTLRYQPNRNTFRPRPSQNKWLTLSSNQWPVPSSNS